MGERFISAFLLEGAVAVCEKRQLLVDDILAAGGTDLATIRSPDAKILRSQGVAIINAIAGASDEPSDAFLSGLLVPMGQNSKVADAFLSASDINQLVVPLNTALGGICGGWTSVLIGRTEARISIGFPTWNLSSEEPWYEAAVGALFCALRIRFGETWKPIRILIGHRRLPPEYTKFLGIETVIGAPDNAVIMARSDAFRKVNDSTHPSPKNDAEIHTQTVYSLSDQTRMIISGRMGLAQKTLLRDAAGVFEMSERTYKRNLADEGTRFSQIVEEVRMSEAKRLLVGTHISITEIAQVLGYAHLPSFNRAFRRASGQTPSEHRSRAQ